MVNKIANLNGFFLLPRLLKPMLYAFSEKLPTTIPMVLLPGPLLMNFRPKVYFDFSTITELFHLFLMI